MKVLIVAFLLAGIALESHAADNFCQGKKNGLYTYPPDCSKFYQCFNGVTYIMPCAPTTWFSPGDNRCERPGDIKPKPKCQAPKQPYPSPQPTQPTPRSTRPKPTPQKECSNNKVGLVPHASICSKFVSCTGNGLGVVKTCPKKTNFDPVLKVCVWENMYDCKGLRSTQGPTDPLAGFCAGKKDGQYTHPFRCDKFISCVAQRLVYVMDCPPNLYYNETTNQCDYPQNVNCKMPPQTTQNPTTTTTTPTTTTTTTTTTTPTTTTTTTPTTTTTTTTTTTPTTTTTTTTPTTTTTTTPTTTTTTTTTTTPTTTTTTTTPTTAAPMTTPTYPLAGFCAGKKDGQYTHPFRCDKFISCVAQRLVYVMDCPPNLYYNETTNQCDYPQNVNCKTNHLATTARPYCQGKKYGLHPSPTGNCAAYVICTPDGIYHMQCPKPMLFDRITKSCQNPANANCNTPTTNSPLPTNVPSPTTARATHSLPPNFRCKGVGFFALDTSCTKYVACGANGIPVVKQCPSKLHFHPTYKVCVWAANYPCKDGQNQNFCHDKKDGNYVDPSHCDQFIACSNSLRYVMKCPPNLWYDPRQDACDSPHNVQCNAKTSTSTSTTTTTTSTTTTTKAAITTISPTFCATNGVGNHPDPTRCDTFISCDKSNRGTRMPCPSGLYYNSNDDICDYPRNVQCNIQAKREVSDFTCNGRAGAFESGFGCNTYFVCDGSTRAPRLKTCPKHQNFYHKTGKCVMSYSYSCVDPDFCKGKEDGKYKNRNNCYGYYECKKGNTYSKDCTAPLRFNGYKCVEASSFVCQGTIFV